MIVALMGVAGCVLLVAGVYMLLGLGSALLAAGVCFLAAAYVTNRALVALGAPEPPEGVR